MDPRRWRWLGLRLLVTALVVGLLLSRVDPRAALEVLASAPTWTFAVPALLLVANSSIHALRLHVLLGALGPAPPVHRLLAALLKASFFSLVLPTGGTEVAKVAFLRKVCGRTDQPLAALAMARTLELVPWGLLLLYGLAWGLPRRDPLLALTAAVFAALFAAVLVGVFLVATRGAALARRLPGRLGTFLVLTAMAFLQVRNHPRRLALALVLAVPFALLNCLVVYLLTGALGVTMSYPEVLAVVPAADTLISLPVTVSGIGVREGVFVHVLAPWGATEATAVAVGVLRWTGELGRAALGGLLYLLGGTLPPPGGDAPATPGASEQS